MAILFSVKNLSRHYGAKQIFENISFGMEEGEKLGLIGPNGSGKSSLLKLIAKLEEPDGGEVVHRSGLVYSMLSQTDDFDVSLDLLGVVSKFLKNNTAMSEGEIIASASYALGICGFENFETKVSELSGGQKKRLAIARAISNEPDLLILDEPTNHMDWDSVLWLQDFIKSFSKSVILVSHDRYFLDQCTNKIMEINALYQDGYLSYPVSYENFLAKKEEYVKSQMELQDRMSNKARREIEWLRAGVKARTTKSRSRQDAAHELIANLEKVKERNRAGNRSMNIEVDSNQQRAKKLLAMESVSISYDSKEPLLKNFSVEWGARQCVGILGENGSGKTSFLKCITKELEPSSGSVVLKDGISVVYFDQSRKITNDEESLKDFLSEGSDYVVYRDRSIHVASYASRFLFDANHLNQKIAKLSGGERARMLVAKLLLQPADILILDEPTNDLDIETIETLEESLSQFDGLLLVVSHDRKFMENLADTFLAFNGDSSYQFYAEIQQWLRERKFKEEKQKTPSEAEKSVETKAAPKRKGRTLKLSFKEKQLLETIEDDVMFAEEEVDRVKDILEQPDVLSNHVKLQEHMDELNEKQKHLDSLYEQWNAIEEKLEKIREEGREV